MRAAERDEAGRAAFRAVMGTLDVDDLVVIDEMGSHLALTPAYAVAPKGERAPGTAPRNHGGNTTLVAALTGDGIAAAMTLDGALDARAFRAFVRDLLCPRLRPGQVVLLHTSSEEGGSPALPMHGGYNTSRAAVSTRHCLLRNG